MDCSKIVRIKRRKPKPMPEETVVDIQDGKTASREGDRSAMSEAVTVVELPNSPPGITGSIFSETMSSSPPVGESPQHNLSHDSSGSSSDIVQQKISSEKDGDSNGKENPGKKVGSENNNGEESRSSSRTSLPVPPPPEQPPCPETNANIFSKWTYTWMDKMFWFGFKNSIEREHLYKLDERFLSKNLSERFEKIWAEEMLRSRLEIGHNISLLRVLHRIFGPRFYWMALPKLISDITQLISPLLVLWLIQYVQKTANQPLWYGYVIVITLFLSQVIGSLCLNYYFQNTMLIGMSVRATLITAIYRKMMKLDERSRVAFSGGKIINMVSSDVSRIDLICAYLHMLWSAPFQFLVTIICLLVIMGVSAVAGVVILALLTPLQFLFMRTLGKYRGENARIADLRVRKMQEILSGIRVIKFFSWEDSFLNKILNIRERELTKVRSISIIKSISGSISFGIPVLASCIALVVYIATTAEPSIATIFSAISFFSVLRVPMMFIPMIISQLADLKIAITRIQSLLVSSEISSQPTYVHDDKFALQIVNATFEWEIPFEEKAKLDVEASAKGKKSTLPPVPAAAPAQGQNVSAAISPEGEAAPADPSFRSTFTMKDINIAVPRGQLMAIVGQVGAGKSSILNAIIGEMKRTEGEVLLAGNIGYSSQQAWIQNATVMSNITFGSPFDRERYDRTIKICALDKDLEILPNGDQTEIGERGINLSGGQKQRINLARCVYSQADIVLLDDPLSAVDSHVGKHLFEKCILQELEGKTRILVTHQLHFLPQVDYILVMKQGVITEQGTYHELIEREGEFSQLMHSYGGMEDEEDKESGTETSGGTEKKSNVSQESLVVAKKKRKSEIRGQMTIEEKNVGAVAFPVYVDYFKAGGGVSFATFMLILLVAIQGIRLATDTWLVAWTGGTVALSTVLSVVIYLSLAAAQTVSMFLYSLLFTFGGVWASRELHKKSLSRVLCSPITFFDTNPQGRIVNRFAKDTDTIDNTLPDAFRMFTNTLAQAFSTFALIIYASPFFVVPLVPLLGVYYFIQLLYRSTSRELKRWDSIQRSPLFAHFSESLNGLATIRAYHHENRFVGLDDDLMDRNNQPYFLQIGAQRWLALRLETIGAFLVLGASLLAVADMGTESAGLIGLSLSYVLTVTGNLNWCVRQFGETEIQMNAVERVSYYCKNLDQEAPSIVERYRPPPGWPNHGSIQFRNVSMRYQPHLPAVLHHLTFDIQPGEKIGIVGRTGSGKSSIMNVLLRMNEPFEGSISIDGVNVLELGLKDLRSNLAIIPQDPVLFNGSIRSNLDPFDEHVDADIWRALENGGMKEAVMRLGSGLEAVVQDNGENLSVGQRQLLCLSRAMLKQPKILILDEATANIDYESDALIQRALREFFSQSTLLTVAHRLNTVIDYDRILLLDQGTVKEFDTPANLLSQPTSDFYSMVESTGHANAAMLRSLTKKPVIVDAHRS